MWGQDSEFVEDLVTRVWEGFDGGLCVCVYVCVCVCYCCFGQILQHAGP